MYNNNQMTQFSQGGGSHPLPPLPPPPPPPPVSNSYQQQPHITTTPPPPPPLHFQQQGAPIPFRGHVNHPFQVPPGGVMQNAGQYGNSLAFVQNSQHSSNVGVQSHHSLPSQTSWALGPPSRTLLPQLPPPPSSQGKILYNPPFIPPPPQHGHNVPPLLPPSVSGFMAPASDGVFLHSNVGNYQVSSVAPPPPPLPSSPPPILPSPPSPAPAMSSASSHAADSVVDSYPYGVAPVHNSDLDQDSGSCIEVAAADRDELLSTRSVNLDLPLPPPRPTEEKTIQKIEALCQLISQNGPDIEDKVRLEEFQNPEYRFFFGGDPETEAANSHAYFLWMKKKYKLEHRWHEKKTDSQIRPLAVDSTGPQYQMHVATESADSDMEMEDDITLTDKDQGPNYAIEALTKQNHHVIEEISMDENTHQLEISTENDPAEVHSPVNDSSEVAQSPMGTVLEKSVTPLAKVFTPNVTSDLTVAINPDRDVGELTRSGSPIRLLQDYASDDTADNDETCRADANIIAVSAGAIIGVSVSHRYSGDYLETDIGSKSPSSIQKGLGQLSKTTLNDSEISPVQESRGNIEASNKNQVSIAASADAFHGKDELGGGCIDSGSKSGNAEQEDERKATIVKVDKYGRHPREAPTSSDSGSDDSHYHQTRRVSKRGRDWSRSRSPLDRGRRRKSLRRRRDRRSWSRSLSPRRRRSRSRSPIRRRTGDFANENSKRDRGQCFDFIRGKCYRGASCRYSHHESDKNASLRRHRNKHDLDVYSSIRNSRVNEGVKIVSSGASDHEHDAIKSQDVDSRQNVTGQVKKRKEDYVRHAVVSIASGIDSQTVSTDQIKSESFREAAADIQETLVQRQEPNKSINDNDSFPKAVNSHRQHLVDGFHPEALSGGDAFKQSGGTHEDVIHLEDGSFVHQRQPNISVGVSGHSGYLPQLRNSTFVSDSSSDQISTVSSSANKGSFSEPLPYIIPSTQPLSAPSSVGPLPSSEHPLFNSQASKELTPHSCSSAELPPHANQLPPPVVSNSQGDNAVHLPQISRGSGIMPQNALLPSLSTTREKSEPYPAPLHTQNPHFSVPPNYSWTSLPLPPPPPPPQQPLPQAVYNCSLPPSSGGAKSFVSSECIQIQKHSGADFVSHTSGMPGLPPHSQSSEFQDQAYPPMQAHSQNFMPTEAFSPKHLSQGNPASQSLSGPNFSRKDYYKQFQVQDSKFSSTGSLHSQPNQYSWQSNAIRLQPSFSGQLPSDDHFKTSSHIYPSSQKQPSIYYFQYSASEGNLGLPLETSTASRYLPDVLDSNHSTSLPAFGGSRISAHYNPYASTFEQPLSSKFSSSIFRQESDVIHGNNNGSPRLNSAVNREVFDGVGPRHTVSSPKSARPGGQILPRSSDKQYDPLFDSIEPTSSSVKKFDLDQKQEVTGESNVSLRPKSAYMSLDVEEQNKHEEVAAVASTTSQNNDEYGETADAELDDVENDSISNHEDVANMTTGDVEINQIKSPGKRKKSKDSRSMKLFKVSIANFVKDVLKPSWRQGNMSKVAFKTIVKKTVDKVSGAMKGHRIPKSEAKISQYIDSSQRKLTKLVMGYVDKYVKA